MDPPNHSNRFLLQRAHIPTTVPLSFVVTAKSKPSLLCHLSSLSAHHLFYHLPLRIDHFPQNPTRLTVITNLWPPIIRPSPRRRTSPHQKKLRSQLRPREAHFYKSTVSH